jgi:hypothetical protein
MENEMRQTNAKAKDEWQKWKSVISGADKLQIAGKMKEIKRRTK